MSLVQGSNGSTAIRSLRGLQVVNGGQTVASIHRARDRDGVDLSQVYVQAKITVVEPERLETLVPFISRYSNTQNKVYGLLTSMVMRGPANYSSELFGAAISPET